MIASQNSKFQFLRSKKTSAPYFFDTNVLTNFFETTWKINDLRYISKNEHRKAKTSFFRPQPLFLNKNISVLCTFIHSERYILFLDLNPFFIAILPLDQNLLWPKSVKFEQGSKCLVHRHPLNLLPFWQILPFKIIRNGC